MTVKVHTDQFINTVIASHFWLILVLCEIVACHQEERPFEMRKKVLRNQFINAVIASPFWLILVGCVIVLSISEGGLSVYVAQTGSVKF